MKITNLFVAFFLIMQGQLSWGQSINDRATKTLKNIIGKTIKGFMVYSMPTTNYGVGTSCVNKWSPKGIMANDMARDLGLENETYNERAWKNVNGFAYYGKTGGSLDVTDKLNTEYGVGLLLPKIFAFLNIDGSYINSKNISVKLTIDSALVRNLDFNKYKEYVQSGKNAVLKNAWDNKNIILATSDFVLMDYSLEFIPVDSVGFSVNAKIDSAYKVTQTFLSPDDSLGFKFTKNRNGHYIFKSIRPVVFAIYRMKQSKLEGLSNETDFSEWDPVTTEDAVDPKTIYKK